MHTFIHKYFNIVQAILSLACIAMVLWLADKGLFLPDEGLYYAYLNPDVDNYHSVINYDLFFKLLYRYTSIQVGIWESRILRIFLLGITISLFWPLFKKWEFQLHEKIFISITVFAGYGLMPQSLSYYTLGFFFAAFFFLIMYYLEKRHKSRPLLFLLQGVICSLAFLVKPPLGLLLFIVLIGRSVLFLYSKEYRLFLITFLISNLGFWFIQYGLHFEFPYYTFLNVIRAGKEFQEYSVLHNGIYVIKKLLSTFQWVILLGFAGYLFGLNYNKAISSNRLISYSLYFIPLSIILFFLYKHSDSNRFGIAEYSLTSSAVIVLGFLLAKMDVRKITQSKLIIYIILFLLPFMCQFGSNVYFFRICQYYAFFWWLLVFVICRDESISLKFLPYLSIGLSLLIIYNIYLNQIKWRLDTPVLLSNLTTYNYPGGRAIQISKDHNTYFENLKTKINLFSNRQNQSYVLGMYELPGDILFSGAKIFYNPLCWGSHNLSLYLRQIRNKFNSYHHIFPLVITKDYKMAQDQLAEWFNSSIVDSVTHWQGGKVFILQTCHK